MGIACPCRCGRQLPLDRDRLTVIARDHAASIGDIALRYALPIWAVRHIKLAT